MNWLNTSGLTSLAKNALKEAQKTIDKALDIQDESGDEQEDGSSTQDEKSAAGTTNTPPKESSDFFASWGLTVSAESTNDDDKEDTTVVTESPSKSTPQSVWGSFAGSFFEQPKSEDNTIVRPPKAKSMNVIADSKYGSQDDLFSKSQLIMSDGDGFDNKTVKPEKVEERRGSSRSHRLSLVSRNSSDSVETLSQSMKTTPDSEPSVQTMSHSSSIGHKLNSESVEILPDSLVSPSSIECLGFDSYCSEKNSSSPSLMSPDLTDKKSTPIGDRTERPETADSVSLVADDDEDTMSYNSVSECTAPTVLDTDDKPSGFLKPIRTEPQRKVLEKDFLHLDQSILPQKMQISENSSNDGSWSDRTLNADNDSINIDTVEEQKKELDHDELLMDKLSDSSSFYNVNVSSTEMIRSESSAFVNVEKQQCHSIDSDTSQRECSGKERISPISSDSKSDLVKIGSDRTSGHTSGDELETATSSDIEIIPSPNGDNGHGFCRSSPAKYCFKQGKFDGTTSPNLVDLVLGKTLATKVRGHNRELSEASIQSNTSDESQGSENDRLMRRLCEMAEILEARENRLMEVSRNNAELAENNADLKSQLETLLAKHEVGDINMITEDYTQRMSALEKKFQQAIREKDQLRKQLDNLKTESARKNSSELENALKEKDDVIAQLQEEGEKLAKQQLQHSNIIKKLRVKEKDNEQVIKSLRDKIAEQTAELDRIKRSMAAKEELEVNQIEAVYRLTTANKKLETELMETKSALDDTSLRLESTRTSLDAARKELTELQRSSAELQRRRAAVTQLEQERNQAEQSAERLRAEVGQLRAELQNGEKRWVSREETLRSELRSAREYIASLEAGSDGQTGPDSGTAGGLGAGGLGAGGLGAGGLGAGGLGAGGLGAGGLGAGGLGAGGLGAGGSQRLLEQLAALQRDKLAREQAHATTTALLTTQIAELQTSIAKVLERERVSRSEVSQLQQEVSSCGVLLQEARARLQDAAGSAAGLAEQRDLLTSKISELETLRSSQDDEISQLKSRLADLEDQLAKERSALDIEKKRNSIFQEQLSQRGDISPPRSVSSDSHSVSLWEEGPLGNYAPQYSVSNAIGIVGAEESLWGYRVGASSAQAQALAAQVQQVIRQRDAACADLAAAQHRLDQLQCVQEQYDALLQMYGEKEEQLAEVRLDLQDVTQLYKQQLDELIALKQNQRR